MFTDAQANVSVQKVRMLGGRNKVQDGGLIERDEVRKILKLAGKGSDGICECFSCALSMWWLKA